jgi:hypothetical protein
VVNKYKNVVNSYFNKYQHMLIFILQGRFIQIPAEKSKRQRHLLQRSKTAAADFLLQRTGAAGIQINEITVFCAPDIFSRLFFARF